MLKEKLGRILPALVALLLLGTSMATSAQARVAFQPTNAYNGGHMHSQLSSGNAAEWIGAVGAAVAGVSAVAAAVGGAAEESTVVIIIILAGTPVHHAAISPAQRASYTSSFDR